MTKEKPVFLRDTATKDSGFTLIELLIVIAIIAILAAAVIIAVNPGEQLSKARDATRERHVQALESALYVYQYDNAVFPAGITSTLTEICNTNIEGVVCGGLTDLSGIEIGRIPVDPLGGIDDKGTGYLVAVLDGKLFLDAPRAETRLVDVGINGLVGWWKMDEDPAIHGTTIADNSGYGNHGTLSTNDGTTNKSVDGKINRALSFDGMDDYVEIDYFNSKNGSIVFWFAPRDNSGSGQWENRFDIVSGQHSSGVGRILFYRLDSNTLSFYYYTNEGVSQRNIDCSAWSGDEWQHIALLFGDEEESGFMQIVVNGVALSPINITGEMIKHEKFYIMADGGSNRFTAGKVDDFYMYNRILSQQEIQSLYSQTKHKYLAENE